MNKTIVIPIFLIASVAAGMMFAFPQYNIYKAKLIELENKKAEIEGSKSYYEEAERISIELEKYSNGISGMDVALPGDFLASLMNDYFQKKPAEAGLILRKTPSISSSTSSKYTGLQEHTATLSFVGSYPAIKNFLKTLEDSSRLFEVENIALTSPEDVLSPFTADISIKFYSY